MGLDRIVERATEKSVLIGRAKIGLRWQYAHKLHDIDVISMRISPLFMS